MSLWKILTSPGGVEGCRASMDSAVKLNIKRATQGSPYAKRVIAVASALGNRYRVVRKPFDPSMMFIEAAPLAWPEEMRVPRITAEYVVDQEFPAKVSVWLEEMMPDLLHDFVSAEEAESKGAVGEIFLTLTAGHFTPHWAKWLRTDTLELIYDVARESLESGHPHLFAD